MLNALPSLSPADRKLARRIEAGHAHSGLVSAPPDEVLVCGEGVAICQGADSPFSQALAIGMQGPLSAQDLDTVEQFFFDRDAPAILDLCTLADETLLALVFERGYTVLEISNVLARTVTPTTGNWPVQIAQADEMRDWARLVMQGFTGAVEIPEADLDLIARPHPGLEAYFAGPEGARVAAAAMDQFQGLATFFGDATLAEARGQGWQRALIEYRLARAAGLECDLASASVLPGSISHRNYERAGFAMLYARVKVKRPRP